MSKIAKKTQSQITSIEKEESDKRVAKRKEEADKKKAIADEEERQRLALIKIQYETYKEISDAQIKDAQERTAKEKADALKQQQEDDAAMEAITKAENDAYEKEAANKIRLAKLDADITAEVEKNEQSKRDALKGTGEALNAIGEIVGKQTVAGKALGTATALINTFLGITEIWRNKTVLPEPFGTISKVAATVTAAASGFAAVRGIMRTQVPGAGGGGAGSIPSMPTNAPVTPMGTSTSLNAASIQGIGNAAAGGVGRAYVLDSDIRNSDERQMRLQRAARLG